MLNPHSFSNLIYCVALDLPHPVITALLPLADYASSEELRYAWAVWQTEEYMLGDDCDNIFLNAVRQISGTDVLSCLSCNDWEWIDNSHALASGDYVCGSCVKDYTPCDGCGLYTEDHDITYVGGYRLGRSYCSDCLGDHCYYCDECDEWDIDEHEHEPDPSLCECESPNLSFQFPAVGTDSISTFGNDERITVTLPAGVIDEVGLKKILLFLIDSEMPASISDINEALNEVGNQWQSRRGNFTRRLARELHKRGGLKMPDGVISEVGNLARRYSSESSKWSIEMTRNLNMPPEAFCHQDSCWWQSYSASRCALKNWGGLGLRAFHVEENYYDDPIGRAWVQPLNADLSPTHDTMNARAYMVYNCYGHLSGYVAARIIGHLTSMTYRGGVEFCAGDQYINNNTAWIVSDIATCENTSSLSIYKDCHDVIDAFTFTNNEVPA